MFPFRLPVPMYEFVQAYPAFHLISQQNVGIVYRKPNKDFILCLCNTSRPCAIIHGYFN